MGKRILIEVWGGVAIGDKRREDDNLGLPLSFLGSQPFLKQKPGTLESHTILLRHRGFLNKFLLQGTQGHHRLNLDQFPRGGT